MNAQYIRKLGTSWGLYGFTISVQVADLLALQYMLIH
jgi:hypothetical protein